MPLRTPTHDVPAPVLPTPGIRLYGGAALHLGGGDVYGKSGGETMELVSHVFFQNDPEKTNLATHLGLLSNSFVGSYAHTKTCSVVGVYIRPSTADIKDGVKLYHVIHWQPQTEVPGLLHLPGRLLRCAARICGSDSNRSFSHLRHENKPRSAPFSANNAHSQCGIESLGASKTRNLTDLDSTTAIKSARFPVLRYYLYSAFEWLMLVRELY